MNQYVLEARLTDPEGATCGFCGKENDNADDCGWWFLSPNPAVKHGRPACNACHSGEPGQKHRQRFGVGDR